MTTTQAFPEISTKVTFRTDFSAQLVGVEFTVDAHYPARGENPRDMVGLKRKVSGRWGYRLAYVSDLIAVS